MIITTVTQSLLIFPLHISVARPRWDSPIHVVVQIKEGCSLGNFCYHKIHLFVNEPIIWVLYKIQHILS